MSKIKDFFINKKKKALIPYIVAGHPNLDKSLKIMHTLVKNGADIIELGIPFSDPMADGSIIQNAIKLALENKVSLVDILNLVKEFRKDNSFTPIVLMGYLNPILKMGYEKFSILAKRSGVDGVLVVDCPFEYINDLRNCLFKCDIDCIFLIAPTTPVERIKNILHYSRGFLYYVSLKGVTGSKDLELEQVKNNISQFKHLVNIPIVVGFGINDIEQAKKIVKFTDGIVVGSYIVDAITNNKGNEEHTIANVIKNFRSII